MLLVVYVWFTMDRVLSWCVVLVVGFAILVFDLLVVLCVGFGLDLLILSLNFVWCCLIGGWWGCLVLDDFLGLVRRRFCGFVI